MPLQFSEVIDLPFVWTVAGVPTSGLAPAPTVDVIAPDGTVLIAGGVMTEQAAVDRYIYTFTAPAATSGVYEIRANTADATVDIAYFSTFVAVGQDYIENLDAAMTTRSTPAQVNTEVLDVLTVDTFTQPPQEAPAATTTLMNMLRYLYKGLRNKHTVDKDDALWRLFADDGTTVDQQATISDDGTTFTRGEIEIGV